MHNAAADGMGKIGVLVALSGTDNGIGRQIAMHVAAANPAALSEADMDASVMAKELPCRPQSAGRERVERQAEAGSSDPQQHHPRPDEEVRGGIETLLNQAFV